MGGVETRRRRPRLQPWTPRWAAGSLNSPSPKHWKRDRLFSTFIPNYAAVVKRLRPRESNTIDGFIRSILLILCSRGDYIMMLLIKSTLVDRKIAAIGCSAASLLE